MGHEEEAEQAFDIENVMAEIQVAAPELTEFLAWVAGQDEIDADDLKSTFELVYSYAKNKNDDEEAEMYDRG